MMKIGITIRMLTSRRFMNKNIINQNNISIVWMWMHKNEISLNEKYFIQVFLYKNNMTKIGDHS